MTADELPLELLRHISSEVVSLRGEVRRVIELEAEARETSKALDRAFREIHQVNTELDATQRRVSVIENQMPISNLVRNAVFAMIALGIASLLAVVFQGALRQPSVTNDYRAMPPNHEAPVAK